MTFPFLSWRGLAVVGVLVTAVLAGCIGAPEDGDSEQVEEDPCALGALDDGIRLEDPAHDPIEALSREDQWNHDLRNVRTCSLPAIGQHDLREGDPHRYIGEIDMRGDLDLGAVAVLGNGEQPMAYLLDITNRSEPEVISVIEQENTYLVDAKISEDGDLLFTASQNVPSGAEFENLPELTGPTGFSVYDISDPTDPQWLLTHPDPQVGCHMMSHKIIDGTDWLFCVSQQVRAYQLGRAGGQVAVNGFVDYLPDEEGVPTPSWPPLVGAPVPDLLTSGPHDMTVQEDPVTGRTYATVSHWDAGVRIVDVTEMPLMEEVGSWKGEGADHYDGNVHTAMMFYVGEDRYVAATPEYTYDGVVPSVWILDANDLSDLKLVGEWYHPNEHDAEGLFLTLHQWQVAPQGPNVTDPHDVRIYITYNHAGVWVLDVGSILAGNKTEAILGYNLARDEVDPDTSVGNAVLNTWDVNVVDGYIYGSDRATGLWVFHYHDDELGDPAVTGFA